MLFSRRFLSAWVVLALALAGTLSGWRFAARLVEARAQVELDAAADAIVGGIRRRLTAYGQVLHAGAALFATSGVVTRAEWRDFVVHLKIDEHFPGIQGIGFAWRIAAAELDAHVRAVRAEGFPDYSVRPAGARETYAPILYLEPFGGRNLRAFGYDMFSEPVRREAMQRACDTADGALSGKVKLVQETGQDVQSGFLLYVPVYAGTGPRSPSGARCATLAGWTYAPFRMNDFMHAFVGRNEAVVDLEIFDGPAVEEEALLFDLGGPRGFPRPANGFWQRRDTLELAGRNWTLLFHPQPAYLAGLDDTPRLVLAGGGIISLLLFAIAATLATARERAFALAGRLNRELRQSHDALETRVAERTRELSDALRQIEAQNQALAAANRAKTEFLHTMRHELRTPLNAVIGFAELLVEGIPQPLPEAQRRHAQDILDAGHDLLKLINEILQYAAADADRLPCRPQPIEPKAFLAERLRGCADAADGKGVALALEVADGLPPLEADPQHLRAIIDNLLDNAVKFTPAGGRVTLRAAAANGDMQEIAVADTGVGIAAADLPRLFHPFAQLDAGLARHAGGTGMGLALARRLAELHGGDIRVDSAPGRGSVFTLRLPRHFLSLSEQ